DLIMLPTHGYGPFRRFLLGSVTAKVLHDAECPVWTAAHMEDAPIMGHLACRKIICAVDRSADAGNLMKWAARLACDTGATLRFLHVVPGIEAWPEGLMDREFEETLRVESRKDLDDVQNRFGIHAPLCRRRRYRDCRPRRSTSPRG